MIYRFKHKNLHVCWAFFFGLSAFILGCYSEVLLSFVFGFSRDFMGKIIGPIVEEGTKIIVIVVGLRLGKPFSFKKFVPKMDLVKFGATVGLWTAFWESLAIPYLNILITKGIFSWPFHIISPAVAVFGIWKSEAKLNNIILWLCYGVAIFIHIFHNCCITPILAWFSY